MRILNVVGARPNFMKIAPLMAEYSRYKSIHAMLVHTGQHYGDVMSDFFFTELGIPEPDINLEVGSGSHAVQTAEIMKRFEPVLLDYNPDVVVVVGDVNSTVACGLVAVKLGVKLAHVEAGLRSFDKSMPEEINRVLTDSVSDFLFCTERSAVDNLLHEGIAQDKIHLVGNVMIDTLLKNRKKIGASDILSRLSLSENSYVVVTLHRPSNVDNPVVFGKILDALEIIQNDIPVIFPTHPRTRQNMLSYHFSEKIEKMSNLHLINPLGYLDFLKLVSKAKVVLTDSGGIQDETTILRIPCLTLRDKTERPVTTELGTNQVVGIDPSKITQAYSQIIDGSWSAFAAPPFWDGFASRRIVKILFD